VETRFCGRCQQWLPNTIALHDCVPAPQKRRVEWQCPDCKEWYEPNRKLPHHGHVCTASRKPVNAAKLVERLALPSSAGMKLLGAPTKKPPPSEKKAQKAVTPDVTPIPDVTPNAVTPDDVTPPPVTPNAVTPSPAVTPDRFCVVCGVTLADKQASATTCSAKCRVKKGRAEAKAAQGA
jgi:hypothetical protein